MLDPTHPGKQLLERATSPKDGGHHVYLPAGYIQWFTISRPLLEQNLLLQMRISVFDNAAAYTVLDEIAGDLDPKDRWPGGIYAKDLDDGSRSCGR